MQPLTLGTAGHIDHGKTALIRALTGVDCDRLPEEQERGITIELGYASLRLPSGRRLSVVDVPGHERFVRTMVAGATGIDLFLMVVAADDGVMPQTREHAAVLRALGVRDGVVALTKADLREQPASAGVAELLPGAETVPCSARTGAGLPELLAALERAAERARSRATRPGPVVLHVDRAFTVHGAGRVVTGTLWSGTVAPGDRLVVLPAGDAVRVRGVHVHDERVPRAAAGQRVALNLVGARAVARGDVVAGTDAAMRPSHVLDVRLDGIADVPRRAMVHHGTRATVAIVAPRDGGLHQLRTERPLLARAGDHVVVRTIAPPDTLGGGVVVDPRARKAAVPAPASAPAAAAPSAAKPRLDGALEARLRAAGHEPPSRAELGEDAEHLGPLIAAGRAVRIGRDLYAHTDALAEVRERVIAIAQAEDGITLARLRDELQTTRRYAQALLEHLDATRVTLRRPDDRRTIRRSALAARER